MLFPLVLAPAERWLGTLRTIVAFFIGHVGATLITAAVLALLIHHDYLPRRLRDVVDVGSSYGFMCVAGLFTYRLPYPLAVGLGRGHGGRRSPSWWSSTVGSPTSATSPPSLIGFSPVRADPGGRRCTTATTGRSGDHPT